MSPLRQYIRLILETAPSRLTVHEPTLSADSTGFEKSHLDDFWQEPAEEDPPMAQHLMWAEENEEDDKEDVGPVPPSEEKVHIFPDPYVRGQYDNATLT